MAWLLYRLPENLLANRSKGSAKRWSLLLKPFLIIQENYSHSSYQLPCTYTLYIDSRYVCTLCTMYVLCTLSSKEYIPLANSRRNPTVWLAAIEILCAIHRANDQNYCKESKSQFFVNMYSQFPSAIGWRKKSYSYNHKTTIWVSH